MENALIFNAGAGSTTLINKLLENGYSNIIVNDIAASALTDLKNDLTIHKNKKVQFIVDDLTNPTELLNLKNIDLWHDRAVLHFFTKESQQNAYFNLIKKAVKPDGFVILAEFNKEGAKKCYIIKNIYIKFKKNKRKTSNVKRLFFFKLE